MKHSTRLGSAITFLACVAFATTVSAQGRGGRGRGQAVELPDGPVVAPIPQVRQVTGPGPLFEGVIMDLPPGDDLAHFGYVMDEYFVSGTANDTPYTTRILVRRPSDRNRASGFVLAEGMHPSGNSWMFHFTHTYLMSEGHVGVEIVTSGLEHLTGFNEERYADLSVEASQANEILAQVGALLKSDRSPLGPGPRKLILMGTSASSAIVLRYLPAHRVYRLADMGPIYDGFLPTSNISRVPEVDVPVIQIPTMTEVESLGEGTDLRPDGDAPGDQFRIYEFAGMSHNDSRFNTTYQPDPCMYPVSRFPLGAFMSVGLDHLIRWVDQGALPPRAEKLRLDYDESDGSRLALDEFGNATGGIRNTYVDFPLVRYGVRNQGADPPIPNPSRMIAARPAGTANQLCGLAGYETPLSAEQLGSLYEGEDDYRQKVEARLDELTAAGWFLPVYRDLVLGDAEAARLP